MADYSAKIKLIVEGLQSLSQVEERVKNLTKLAAVDLGKALSGQKSLVVVKKEVDGIANSFSRLGKITRGLAVGTGLGALAKTVNDVSLAAASIKIGGISKLAAVLATTTGPAAALFKELSNLAIQFPVVAGTATVAGAALLAFAPQVIRAGNATTKLAKAAAEAGQPLARLIASLVSSGFRADLFIDAAEAAEIYRTRLFELSETVDTLSRRQSALQNTLNKFNSDSETAAKIAVKLVDITRRLNAEQQAQNDLLRQAAGLRPQSVENRATNTFNVTQRRKQFIAEQAQATAEAARQVRSLEQAESEAARTRLAQAAREKATQLKEQAAAADQALIAIRNLETAESAAARARLAAAADQRKQLAGAAQAYAFPIGPNPASGRRISAFGEVSAATAERALIEKEKRILFEQEKAQLAQIDQIRASNARKEEQRFKNLGKTISGSLSSAAIGGAFPLLFGQSPQAAVGGAIGGLLGGAGGGFAGSLIGTAIGDLAAAQSAVTELGQELGFSESQAISLAEAFSQAGRDSDKLNDAIRNIQGIGLSTNETASAVKLVSELTSEYGGKVDKVAQALANALESGKVGISTLNAFTAQGIPIQEELAQKYGVSRDKLLQLTKDGEVSVQDLVNALIEIGKAAESSAGKSETAFDKFKKAVETLSTAVANLATTLLRTLGPALNTILDKITTTINALNTLLQGNVGRQLGQAGAAFTFGATSQGVDNITGVIQSISSINPQSVREVSTLLSNLEDASRNLRRIGPSDPNAQKAVDLQGKILQQRTRLLEVQQNLQKTNGVAEIGPITAPGQLAPSTGTTGKGPEDRTVSLQADLDAITKIGNAENLIRDFLFQGRETLAAEVELSKTLDDIERDRIKQLQQANFESEKAVINKIAFVRESIAEQVLADKLREINSRRFKEELDAQEAVRNSIKVFTDLRKEREQEAQYGKTYLKLLRDGVLPAEAARLANFEKLVTEQLSAVEEQIKITELAILEAKARGASTVELEKQLKIFKDQQEAIKGEAQKGPGQGPTQKERLEEAIATSRGELNELVDPINQIVNGAKAIGSAFADAFRGLVSGALTGQQALAAFFKNVGDYFLETASQIIAKLIEIYILETIVGFISGAATGSSFQAKSNAAGKATFGGSFKGTGSSTFGSGGIRIPGFAEGGFVTGPTRALIGEGGEPEYVIPASKMPGAMARYAVGIRGGGVIDGAVSDNRNFLDSLTTGINGSTVATSEQPADAAAATRASLRETERFRETQMQVMNQQTERERRFERERMEQMASTPGNLNIRYESQVINNVEYVTREQAERLAAQSALRGRELAINSLQTSVKTRKRVGMA